MFTFANQQLSAIAWFSHPQKQFSFLLARPLFLSHQYIHWCNCKMTSALWGWNVLAPSALSQKKMVGVKFSNIPQIHNLENYHLVQWFIWQKQNLTDTKINVLRFGWKAANISSHQLFSQCLNIRSYNWQPRALSRDFFFSLCNPCKLSWICLHHYSLQNWQGIHEPVSTYL